MYAFQVEANSDSFVIWRLFKYDLTFNSRDTGILKLVPHVFMFGCVIGTCVKGLGTVPVNNLD